jgi:hypothetical protein
MLARGKVTGASVKTVQHEVARLVESGLLADRKVGTPRLVRSVRDSLLTRPLRDLLAVTYGPLPVITEALSGLSGWSTRSSTAPGRLGTPASRARCQATSMCWWWARQTLTTDDEGTGA